MVSNRWLVVIGTTVLKMAARRSLALQVNHCDMVPPGVNGGCYPNAAVHVAAR